MKDRNKSSRKKSRGSPGVRSAKRTGSGGGARRSRAASPTGRSAQQTTPAQIEARFRAVFESPRDAIGVSKNGIHVFVNPAYLKLFGLPAGTDLEGKPILDLIAVESRDQIKAYIRRRTRGEAIPSIYETRGLRADGSEFDMEVTGSIYQEKGENHTLVILRDITERKRAEEEIAERGAMLQQIMDTASVAIGLVDKTGRITHANRRMAEMFGRTLEELIGCEYVELVHPSEREASRQKMLDLLASEIPSVDLERLYWRKDGTQFWGHLACRRFHDVHGNELGLIGVITDIDKRKQFELALTQSEAKYRRLYNDTPVLLHSIDRTGTLVEVNDYWLKTLEYERDEVLGRKVTDFYNEVSRKRSIEVVQPAFFREGFCKDIPFQFLKKNGQVVDVLLSATGERDAVGNVVLSRAVSEDITDRKKAEEKLRNLSLTDELTHLYNRRGFFTLGEPLLKLAKRHKNSVFLLYADLDNLKEINDVLGHHQGDQAIIDTANVLKATCRETDIVARIGGDEFVVIPVACNKEDADMVTARFKEHVRARNEKNGCSFKLSVSVGMSSYDPGDPHSIEDLLKQAEKLMYEEKMLKQKTD